MSWLPCPSTECNGALNRGNMQICTCQTNRLLSRTITACHAPREIAVRRRTLAFACGTMRTQGLASACFGRPRWRRARRLLLGWCAWCRCPATSTTRAICTPRWSRSRRIKPGHRPGSHHKRHRHRRHAHSRRGRLRSIRTSRRPRRWWTPSRSG